MSGIDVVMAIFWGALTLGCLVFLAQEAWCQFQEWRLRRRLKRLERAQRELAEGAERWRDAFQPVWTEVMGRALDARLGSGEPPIASYNFKQGARANLHPETEGIWREAGYRLDSE